MKITSQGPQAQIGGSVLPLDRPSSTSESLRKVVKAAFLGFLAAGQSRSLATPAASALQLALPVMALQTLPLACAQSQMAQMNIGGTGAFPELYPSQVFPVRELPRGFNTAPQVASLSNGNKALAWLTPNEESSESTVTIQYVDQDGMKVGKELVLETDPTVSDVEDVGITAGRDGGCLITWTAEFEAGISRIVFMQRIDASGKLVGEQIQGNSPPRSSDIHNPKAAELKNGRLVLGWQDSFQLALPETRLQLFDEKGEKVGAEIKEDGLREFSDIIPTPEGGFILVEKGFLRERDRVVATLYNSDGRGIKKLDLSSDVRGFSAMSEHSAVALANGGGYIAAGLTIPEDGEKEKFAIRTFDESGDVIDEVLAETRLSHTDPLTLDPNIVFLEDGSFIALGVQEGTDVALFGERFSPEGEAIGGVFSIELTRRPASLDVVPTREGGAAFVWRQAIEGSKDGVFFKLFAQDAIPTWMPSTSRKEQATSSTGQVEKSDSGSASSVSMNAAGRVYNPLTTGGILLTQLWLRIFG